jgi:FtsP/CotA-like multicopper oxidase with cupredoxin domain
MSDTPHNLSRRDFLKLGAGGATGLVGAGVLASALLTPPTNPAHLSAHAHHPSAPHENEMVMPGLDGEVDHEANGFHPSELLTSFDYGKVSTLSNGQTLREYEMFAATKTVEIAPGISFEAWTYNGRIPGPTIRAREGDRLRIHFTNATAHAHSIHFHGIHPGNMDGVFEPVPVGGRFTYEFDAEPFGLHLYHCHVSPLAEHISKGLYGAFIVEPQQGWSKADHEFVMVMNGFDIDFDNENDFYAVNAIPFHYDKHPIKIKTGELVRIFLVNMLEFDAINSFHLHGNFFHYYPTGTSQTPSEFTDTIMQAQAQRGILEFRYKYPGRYMFHAHKVEFADLGWTGVFEVEVA